MASVNKVIIVGSLGKDPEIRYAPDGTCFANVSVATSESWKDKTTGERKENTEWHRVVFSGALAEIAEKFLKKGSSVYLEGSLRTRKWQNKEGVDQYTTEIRVTNMQMLGKKGDSEPEQPPRQSRPASTPAPKADGFGDFDDDIPF